MTNSAFAFPRPQKALPEGSFTWKAPSNIALIKYWGKHGNQLPANPSLSFTLSNCVTQTTLNFKPLSQTSEEVHFEVIFDGQPSTSFRPKIEQFFNRIVAYLPFIKDYQFEIHTENSFPHSSGIASSASGMSALALCLMQMQKEMDPKMSEDHFYQKASFLARLGSGSAARSVSGPMMVWGKHPEISKSSDVFAIKPSFELHPVFQDFQDSILIVDKGEKQVSSSLGHDLMIGHPYAKARYEQAFENLELLTTILQKGDLNEFVKIVESEALTLHAMMMTSSPYFLLMKPNTLKIIEKIWEYRKQHKSYVCFTLDAGANLHLLYPAAEKENILKFVQNELIDFCEDGRFIEDQIGFGPERLSI
ncbi:MAG TPA: hypothetical protein VK021_10245 [Flavobacteriaceae bacterium]|nr:hypothetical protein [Flavobacteriaceae bacterium]